jgi:hypothetical protein
MSNAVAGGLFFGRTVVTEEGSENRTWQFSSLTDERSSQDGGQKTSCLASKGEIVCKFITTAFIVLGIAASGLAFAPVGHATEAFLPANGGVQGGASG